MKKKRKKWISYSDTDWKQACMSASILSSFFSFFNCRIIVWHVSPEFKSYHLPYFYSITKKEEKNTLFAQRATVWKLQPGSRLTATVDHGQPWIVQVISIWTMLHDFRLILTYLILIFNIDSATFKRIYIGLQASIIF